MSVNIVNCFGVGRLVQDPVLTDSGNTVYTKFTMEVKDRRKNKDVSVEETSFFRFIAWDEGAKVIVNRVKKNDSLYFEGTARSIPYEDKDGKKKSYTLVRINHFEPIPHD